eukprot:jgi/Botrbrau1/10556/Bobra.0343s0005.1
MQARVLCMLLLLCGGVFPLIVQGQGAYDDDDVNMYDDYELFSAGYDTPYDYEDDEGNYVDYPGGDEEYGDYFFDDMDDEYYEDCRLGEDGKPVFNGTKPCDVKVEGADKVLKDLPGGIDGVYEVTTCENGRPMYSRKTKKAGEERVIWYSSEFGDWDLTNGSVPSNEYIIIYGGSRESWENRPQLVESGWSLSTANLKDYNGDEDYTAIDLTMVCADGSKTDIKVEDRYGKKPMLLTEEEADAQYRTVYTRAARKRSSAEVNLGMVTLFVMIGLGIVFGLPFMVARNRRMRKRPGGAAVEGPLSGIAQMLDITRKRDHTN